MADNYSKLMLLYVCICYPYTMAYQGKYFNGAEFSSSGTLIVSNKEYRHGITP